MTRNAKSRNIIIEDYISSLREILVNQKSDLKKRLTEFIDQHKEILLVHLQGNYDSTRIAERLRDPIWLKRIFRFNFSDWRITARSTVKETKRLLGISTPLRIILYPGLGSFNGRVYKLNNRLVIGCCPDFPGVTGQNLQILLAHEYAHLLRWRLTGNRSDNIPIHAMMFEEGFAVWLTKQLFPKMKLKQVFMANLHKEIDMADPPEGFLRWCKSNLDRLANEAQAILDSKKEKDLGRFFQCLRLDDKNTPIRTGYYLGYRIIEKLSLQYSPQEIFKMKPTAKRAENWLNQLIRK